MEYVVRSQLELVPGTLLKVQDGRDLIVYVWRGGVWITQPGDRRDCFVGAGGWFRIDSRGVTLVSALGLGRGTVTLTSTREEGFAERIELVHALGARPLFARNKKPSWASWLAPRVRPAAAAV